MFSMAIFDLPSAVTYINRVYSRSDNLNPGWMHHAKLGPGRSELTRVEPEMGGRGPRREERERDPPSREHLPHVRSVRCAR